MDEGLRAGQGAGKAGECGQRRTAKRAKGGQARPSLLKNVFFYFFILEKEKMAGGGLTALLAQLRAYVFVCFRVPSPAETRRTRTASAPLDSPCDGGSIELHRESCRK